MTTFKQMIQAGTVKRADAMKVQLADIHEEPGFNLRIEGNDLAESIEALAAYILEGGQLPPLEVRPRDQGGVWIVDGHRRARAYRLAVERGAPIDWIPVVAFSGNDVDRVTRIMTSAEGRGLAPLETAMGYKRLASFGLAPEEIARRVGKTRPHVDGLLILANANRDVHGLVASGAVAAATAVQAVREHGEGAGDFLAGHVDKAKASGKAKVTGTDIKGKSLPRVVVEKMENFVTAFERDIPVSARTVIFGSNHAPDAEVSVPVSLVKQLLELRTDIADARDKAEEKARERAAKAAQQELIA